SGPQRASLALARRDLLPHAVGHQHARACAPAVDANDERLHAGRDAVAGAGCRSEASIPTIIVIEVPIKTYHGQATPETGSSHGLSPGKTLINRPANTTTDITAI